MRVLAEWHAFVLPFCPVLITASLWYVLHPPLFSDYNAKFSCIPEKQRKWTGHALRVEVGSARSPTIARLPPHRIPRHHRRSTLHSDAASFSDHASSEPT